MGIPMVLNGIRAIKVRTIFPWRGVWIADVTLDPDDVALVPKGGVPAVLTIGTKVLTGTIDGDFSGTFSTKAAVRVVGGRNGWTKTVPPQHFYNPGKALLSTVVIAATAAIVGEVAVDPIPVNYGEHYVRSGGPASRVFEDRDWFVEPTTGVATVASWPPLPLLPEAQILDYDITQKRVSISSEELVLPGTLVIDPNGRFGASAPIVRDVEQTFDDNGSIAECWCSEQKVSRLAEALANMVREFAGTAHLKTYVYRFIAPLDATNSKMALQPITPGAPNLNPLEQWTGVAGIMSKITPGTEIVVGFAGGDPSAPFIASYSQLAVPIEVDIAGGAYPLTPAPWAIALQAALTTFAAALASDPFAAVAAGVLSSALAALPPPATLLTKAT